MSASGLWFRTAAVGALVTASALLGGVAAVNVLAAEGITELVSVGTGGEQGNDISGRFAGPAISGDGDVAAFDSIATSLVPNDTNAVADVFVRDRTAGTLERVSVDSAGVQANGSSSRPSVDGDGDVVAFDSNATNLVAGDTNGAMDVFVRNRSTATTEVVSVSSDEVLANGASNSPSFSDDGRYVAFVSVASNLVSGDVNGAEDVFVRDRVAGTTERVSVATDGQEGNSSSTATSISADGRYVVFSSFASNLVPGDVNTHFDSFIHDRETGVTELVSVAGDGAQGDAQSVRPAVSADGRLVVFWSDATNLVPGDTNGVRDVFVRDRVAGTTERVSVSSDEDQADGASPEPGVRGFTASGPDITPDGRFVAFFSSATNLVDGDTNTCPLFFEDQPGRCPDAFVRDLVDGTTERVNVSSEGEQANDRSADPVISDDGQAVAFFSAAGNLVAGDANTCPLFADFPGNCPDIFVHDKGGGVPGASADLAVTIVDSPDPVAAGATLTYDIEVTNSGPDPASVTVTDVLPAQVTFGSATASQGSCSGTTTVVCALGDIASGGSAAVTITVTPDTPGTITNTVTVSSPVTDPDGADNTATATTTVQGDVACTITGTEGNDRLVGTSGADVICGLAGNDTIRGLEGDDTLLGGDGRDTIVPGPGANTVDGGSDADSVSYADLGAGVVVDLGAGTATGEVADVLAGVENAVGTGFDDVLSGDGAANILTGAGGRDRLSGGDGNDNLDGGPGDDLLDGGAGIDRCRGGPGTNSVVNCEA